MTPSPWLYDYLRGREKFRPTAYLPTRDDKWTIGYGHTRGVKEGDTCTTDKAEQFLHEDAATAVDCVNRLVCAHVTLTQPQFDALCSLVFNIGGPNFASSTLLTHLLAGEMQAAADQFRAWKYQKKRVLPGLVERREEERARFLSAA